MPSPVSSIWEGGPSSYSLHPCTQNLARVPIYERHTISVDNGWWRWHDCEYTLNLKVRSSQETWQLLCPQFLCLVRITLKQTESLLYLCLQKWGRCNYHTLHIKGVKTILYLHFVTHSNAKVCQQLSWTRVIDRVMGNLQDTPEAVNILMETSDQKLLGITEREGSSHMSSFLEGKRRHIHGSHWKVSNKGISHSSMDSIQGMLMWWWSSQGWGRPESCHPT